MAFTTLHLLSIKQEKLVVHDRNLRYKVAEQTMLMTSIMSLK